MIKSFKNNQRGAALLISIIIILTVSLLIGLSLSFLTLDSAANAQTKIKSAKSYYLAEAGIEDALLRLRNDMQIASSYTVNDGDNSATIEITDPIGGSRTITSQGNSDNRFRKVSVTYSITADEVNFFYGAQAGEGGVLMGSNSQIQGNVFSNGSISGNGEITDTATVANNGNLIEDVTINNDAYVHSCTDSDIIGTLYYVSGGTIDNCTYGNLVVLENQIDPEPLPIPEQQINDWKAEAEAGGVIYGDYTVSDNETDSLGPVKITGNLTVYNNSLLNMTGIIYVQGNITIENNATIQLDSSFGSLSGVIISDGKIRLNNNAFALGSGEAGSFLMLLSTNSSLDLANPAINLYNNAEGAIFYASNGLIHLHNNIDIREATGYKLALDNNAVVSYDVGLENVNFSSGPGGGWSVENWQEIE